MEALHKIVEEVILKNIVAACHLGIKDTLNYVDLEPTGDPFDSIIRLESSERGKCLLC